MAAAPQDESDSWCHLQQTMTMLELTSAQIRSSILDGEDSVSELTATLQNLAGLISQLETLIDSNPQDAKQLAATLRTSINAGVVACQFHDRVSQRLDHVTHSLGEIGALIVEPEHFSDAKKWQLLQDNVKNSYTMESERLMFEHIMMGHSVEEALEIYRHQFNEPEDDPDDVELF